MSLRSRSHVKASVVLTRADHLFIHNYIRSLLNNILKYMLMVRTRLEPASYCLFVRCLNQPSHTGSCLHLYETPYHHTISLYKTHYYSYVCTILPYNFPLTAQYNQLIPLYNQLIPLYNQLIPLYNQLIPQYNQLIPLYNQLIPLYNQLIPLYNQLIPLYNQLIPLYNQLIPQYNQLIPLYNQLIPQYNQLIPQYNQLIPQYNQLIPLYNQLIPLYNQLIPLYNQLIPLYNHISYTYVVTLLVPLAPLTLLSVPSYSSEVCGSA